MAPSSSTRANGRTRSCLNINASCRLHGARAMPSQTRDGLVSDLQFNFGWPSDTSGTDRAEPDEFAGGSWQRLALQDSSGGGKEDGDADPAGRTALRACAADRVRRD